MTIAGKGLRRVGLLAAPSLAVLAAIVGTTGYVSAARGDAHGAETGMPGRQRRPHLLPGFCATIFAAIWAMSATLS